jgi:hypothetical protein
MTKENSDYHCKFYKHSLPRFHAKGVKRLQRGSFCSDIPE